MNLTILFSVFFLTVLTHYLIKFKKHKSLYPFMSFKYNFKRRRDSFKRTLELLKLREAKIIVETGTSRKGLSGTRNDGAATIVFGKWAKENNAHLYSVDICKDSVKGSQDEVNNQQLKDVVTVHLGDSIEYLSTFREPIDLLYLDSYDYSRTDKGIQLKSQAHHLEEI